MVVELKAARQLALAVKELLAPETSNADNGLFAFSLFFSACLRCRRLIFRFVPLFYVYGIVFCLQW